MDQDQPITTLIIDYAFYALFLIVPIIWLPVTSELFEFNKMIVVYLGASVVLTAWLFKSVAEKTFVIKRTPLDIPILLFLLANILSTVFSIDRQTSIFGYYSRFNGGLLSTFAYIILYYALITFFDREKLFRLLKILLLSSVFVTAYGILQHPTPLFRNSDGSFRGIDAGYWQENAQARAFSTLGHANWLAAFILMLTPFAFFFLTQAKKIWEKSCYAALLIAYFVVFTFTYSRGGTIGFVVMLAVLIAGVIFVFRDNIKTFFKSRLNRRSLNHTFLPPYLGFFLVVILIGWLLTLQHFSNAFWSRGVDLTQIKTKSQAQITPQAETQLSRPGTETGKIRLIVWKGALDIFRHYPVFGSGVETFAFSYYQFRPAEHNLTSEWDYLYNKAHNEFLNYLATTGAFGFLIYLALIITFVIWLIINLNRKIENWQKIFMVSALASYAGYHAQNVFGFSVVAIALLFYLIPGFVFVIVQATTPAKISLSFLKTSLATKAAGGAVLLLGALLVWGTLASWLADYYYNKGTSTTNNLEAYQNLKTATNLRPDEPLYKASLASPTIQLALSESGDERKERIAEAFGYLNQATEISPNNINIWQLRLSAVFELAKTENQYLDPAIRSAEIIASLAPTEAKHQYNLATLYNLKKDYKKAQEQLEKTVGLKPDYKEAWQLLLEVDASLKDEQGLRKHQVKFKQLFPQ